MNTTLRQDADKIIRASIQAVLPDEAVRRALNAFQPTGGRVLLVADGTRRRESIGPCGWRRGGDQIRPCEGRNSRCGLL